MTRTGGVIFQVMDAYYRLLDSKGQQEAAEANLKNAQTVRQAAEARLQNGLATLPDVLEARSAEAQADYNLQAAVGATEIAHGDLATALGISPTTQFQVRKHSRHQDAGQHRRRRWRARSTRRWRNGPI